MLTAGLPASRRRGSQRVPHPSAGYDPGVDYYEILQVHPRAHQEVIKRAYRTIIGLLQGHPDLGGAHDQAVRVNEAYAVLSSPELRRAYDEERRQRDAHPAPPGEEAAPREAAAPPRQSRRRHVRAVCARCGANNRLPRDTDPRRALCGKCHAPLTPASAAGASHLPPANVRLTPAMTETLRADGEVRVQRADMPRDGQLHCLRCGHHWQAPPAQPPPAACPQCRSAQWGEYRLFCCRWCGHRFSTHNLLAWAYWLYPECPACRQRQWHPGCERFPLRWLLALVGRLGG